MNRPSRLFAASLATACLGAGLVASAAPAASPAWAPIAASGPTNLPPLQSEIQRLRVDAEGGNYTLTHATETTDPIPFDASAPAVEEKLDALPGLEVSVSGGPGDSGGTSPYFIAFDGVGLENSNVPTMSADSSELTGGFSSLATLTTALDGGPGT
ncbi:MAG TPA: hypothetical protein VFD39_07915, partial [Trueperaceae bacterium]|nr:hypothetical protein [Trueperaceae bacterium]